MSSEESYDIGIRELEEGVDKVPACLRMSSLHGQASAYIYICMILPP